MSNELKPIKMGVSENLVLIKFNDTFHLCAFNNCGICPAYKSLCEFADVNSVFQFMTKIGKIAETIIGKKDV